MRSCLVICGAGHTKSTSSQLAVSGIFYSSCCLVYSSFPPNRKGPIFNSQKSSDKYRMAVTTSILQEISAREVKDGMILV